MRKTKKRTLGKSGLEIAKTVCRAAFDKKAEKLLVLDVHSLCSFADYFVIMSGRSTRHVQGLAEAVNTELGRKRISSAKTEGFQEGLWVLLDFEDVVVHIFYNETRAFYDLEGLWHDAPRVPLEQELLKG